MTSTQNMAKHGEEGQYRSDQSVSYTESNVFSLTDMEEGVSEFTTITSYASDLTMGLGTFNPSCRLSLGKNTANTFADEYPKQSIPAICLNEEADGTDATGIAFYERYDDITGERAEAGMAFVVSNENYATTYDGTIFTNTMDVSQNKTIAMSILSRTSGHNAVLVNHDPRKQHNVLFSVTNVYQWMFLEQYEPVSFLYWVTPMLSLQISTTLIV